MKGIGAREFVEGGGKNKSWMETNAGGMKAEITERKLMISKEGCVVRVGDRGQNKAEEVQIQISSIV